MNRPTIVVVGARRCAVAGVLAIALSACGGGSPNRRATTASTTSTTVAAAATSTSTTVASGEPEQFQLPSGNLGCYIDAAGVRCDIRERSWQPPAKPAPCDVDYGQGIELGDRGAAFVCAGDTTLGAGSTLAYGASIQRGSFRCDSSAEGIECKDSRTGHGFHLSSASYRIF